MEDGLEDLFLLHDRLGQLSFFGQELRINRIPGHLSSIGLTIRVIGPHAF